jgi:hypothetical protein
VPAGPEELSAPVQDHAHHVVYVGVLVAQLEHLCERVLRTIELVAVVVLACASEKLPESVVHHASLQDIARARSLRGAGT